MNGKVSREARNRRKVLQWTLRISRESFNICCHVMVFVVQVLKEEKTRQTESRNGKEMRKFADDTGGQSSVKVKASLTDKRNSI